MDEMVLSKLGHTWIIDLDGTILKHNGYKLDGKDMFLPGTLSFLRSLPKQDMIIFLTSREEQYREQTERLLQEHDIHYHALLCGAPYGERVLINDDKPSGLHRGYAVNLVRDEGIHMRVVLNDAL